jgi:hypothetical protein
MLEPLDIIQAVMGWVDVGALLEKAMLRLRAEGSWRGQGEGKPKTDGAPTTNN